MYMAADNGMVKYGVFEKGDVIVTEPEDGFYGVAVVLDTWKYEDSKRATPMCHIAITPLIYDHIPEFGELDLKKVKPLVFERMAQVGENGIDRCGNRTVPLRTELMIHIYTTRNMLQLRVIGKIDPALVYDGELLRWPRNNIGEIEKFYICGDVEFMFGREAYIQWLRDRGDETDGVLCQILHFLRNLSCNNNREWFNENKQTYLQVRERFEIFARKLIERIAGWDEDIAKSDLQVKDCTYRIYRDTRFSKNKEPYKTHMGIFICKGGKKSPYAGYYLHLEPFAQDDLPDSGQKGVHTQTPLSMGGCFIIAGTYRYESKVLRSIRDEISVNGDSFLEAMAQAEGFYPEESDMLRKVPAEFAFAPDKWRNLLRYKTFALIKPVDTDYICRDGALDRIADDFKKCSNYLKKVNMAIEYAYEED